jgi:hypothetical protein
MFYGQKKEIKCKSEVMTVILALIPGPLFHSPPQSVALSDISREEL